MLSGECLVLQSWLDWLTCVRYWMWQHNKNDKTQTYQYHLDHYGKDFNYDQFLDDFTGKGFDAKEWVDLFADAGAQYFVPTTSMCHSALFGVANILQNIMRALRCLISRKPLVADRLFILALREILLGSSLLLASNTSPTCVEVRLQHRCHYQNAYMSRNVLQSPRMV